VFMAGPVPITVILSVQPIAKVKLDAGAQVNGTLKFEYDDPKAFTIEDINIGIKDGKPLKPTFRANFESVKQLKTTFHLVGGLSVRGQINIGPEIVVRVMGVPFTLWPSLQASLGAAVRYDNINGEHCLQGQITGGIGLDVGTRAPLPDLRPWAIMDKGCMGVVNGICRIPKAGKCLFQNMCSGDGQKLCDKLGKDVKKAFDKFTFPKIRDYIKSIRKPDEKVLKSFKKGKCEGVAPPVMITADVTSELTSIPDVEGDFGTDEPGHMLMVNDEITSMDADGYQEYPIYDDETSVIYDEDNLVHIPILDSLNDNDDVDDDVIEENGPDAEIGTDIEETIGSHWKFDGGIDAEMANEDEADEVDQLRSWV